MENEDYFEPDVKNSFQPHVLVFEFDVLRLEKPDVVDGLLQNGGLVQLK